MSWRRLRLNKRRWARVRAHVLAASNWRCATCGSYGNEVDHVRPIQHGGDPWSLDNLQCLCRGCHIRKTRRENRRPLSAEEAEWRDFVREIGPDRGNDPPEIA